ncbi:kinase-like domain-containing protein [Xylaria grammica]|nr:kinase-like domain-containing protein [Xylaria grammica]
MEYLGEREQTAASRLQEYFENEPGFAFEKVAGSGGFGVTLCFRNKNADPNGHRMIAVKAPTWENEDVPRERQSLRPLVWAQHSVTLLAVQFESENAEWLKKNTIITEYLENGTLSSLKRRLGGGYPRRKLPNRVLWAIFLCLVRGCVGLAYPPGSRTKLPRNPRDQLLETIPDGNRPPRELYHGDLHEANIMIGDFEPREHRNFPVLKFIDFGLSSEKEDAVSGNIMDIGQVMCNLMWSGWDISDLMIDKNSANILDPNLDDELLDWATQCIEDDPADRPSLSALLSAIRPNLQKTYPNIPEESDRFISELIQRNILDAE